jgi:hypothetical protein
MPPRGESTQRPPRNEVGGDGQRSSDEIQRWPTKRNAGRSGPSSPRRIACGPAPSTMRPSRTKRSGADGRAHLAAVIDCPDQKSWATSSLAGAGAKEAERALEVALPARPSTLRLTGVTPVILRQWAHLPEPALPGARISPGLSRSAKGPAADSQPERSLGGSRSDVSARSSVFQT